MRSRRCFGFALKKYDFDTPIFISKVTESKCVNCVRKILILKGLSVAKKKRQKQKDLKQAISVSNGARSYISQTKIPKICLSDALKLAIGLNDNFGCKPTAPYQLAMAVDISPTSSKWQDICGASIAYGLTNGGYNASVISLTDIGRRIVSPTKEGDDLKAKAEAALLPEIAKTFFKQYDRAKFPPSKIACNVLVQMGVPADRAENVLEILTTNGNHVGIVHDTKTGPFVAIDDINLKSNDIAGVNEDKQNNDEPEQTAIDVKETLASTESSKKNGKVFITHGKNKQIVEQLKDLLKFGKFNPIVAEEHETISKPVPDKVLEEMRTCFAGIIHVAGEDELLDKMGVVHHKINENVLIEIGAAMALYKRNFILLVQKGVHLPSNLQGLYRCDYEGEKLDYDATMKLLKAFNEFQ